MVRKKKKQIVNVVTLGCSKNLVDSEVLMRQLDGRYEVVNDSNDPSDIMVINTCGFIADAKEESVDMILSAVEAKKAGELKKVIVTGCLSQRYKKELENEIDQVDAFFGVNDLPQILQTLEADYKKELLGERHLTTPSHYAYLKVSEGCDRHCSFCAIPLIRGQHVSKPFEEILEEAENLAGRGVKELLLIAQDLTYYGLDLYKKRRIAGLVEKLSEIKGIEWIRLHYAYPAGFPEDLLDIMRQNPKVCNYLDIPLQHINNRILQSMKRGLDEEKTRKLAYSWREKVPGMALRSTFIVGYPGETEAEFQQLLDFVKEMRFDRLGVFQYSPEEDTAAFLLPDDVPAKVKQEREDRLMELQQQIALELNEEKVGKTFRVLIDKKEGDFYVGRTEFDSPEVDNEVLIPVGDAPLQIGDFYPVKIERADFYDLYGTVEPGPQDLK
ncbi:30S ribosomal protein S12 methylthiotransferase RimO [Candidatus Sulfidibacterium hydrothermale]|jgi:ribosomal protein S12 methylthiotransferase|uniref:30S ribosomal protein S12 methylthiotransferase RimO n=1 Tax=Candidatus Sulfidibacterium hydrothermale TaxID=2875962 RepID=UPI001F0B62DD|nr:30S ribosomal protein S12 methylthiotransferase RimO [Candidatus Sulfidibacterium hydrothermale]UBM62955.1 30S ribosomal protein S12 methylthiotransferase RimO [Candidatus Sulfidibacterium hydrothermale]